MPKVFRHPEWQQKVAPMLQAVADVVAGQAEADTVHRFWQADKKPEEARAGLARLAFEAACDAGDTQSAAWLQTEYTQHIKIPEFKTATLKAMEAGADDMALWLIKNMPLADVCEKQKDKTIQALLASAMQISRLNIVTTLASMQDTADSGLLYRAALGGQITNLRYMVDTCHDQKTLATWDLNAALVIAVKQGDVAMTDYLLDAGADAGSPREAPLKRAAERFAQDGFTITGLLLAAGADPILAKDLLPAQQSMIDACVKTAQDNHRLKLNHATGLNAQQLRQPQEMLGTTGLHYAANHRVFDQIAIGKMTTDDFLLKDAQGETVLDVIEKRNDVAALLRPARWVGQADMLRRVLPCLSEKTQESLDVRQLLLDVDMQTLRQKSRGLSLKPKGFHRF